MKKFSVKYNIHSFNDLLIDERGQYNDIEMEYALIGDLVIDIGGSEFVFDYVPLIFISTGLLSAATRIIFYSGFDESALVLIPDDEPKLRVEKKRSTIEVSIIRRDRKVAEYNCEFSYFTSQVGQFYVSLTKELLGKNPGLIESTKFRSTYPGGYYFAEMYKLES